VCGLVGQGEQVLVFRAHVDETEATARLIADRLAPVDVPSDLARSISELEDSEGRSVLEALMRRGVAYHNAGLSLEERLLVEEAFRKRQLKVLVSTTTLAMGVNLPADSAVIGDYERWDPRRQARRIIDVAEYKNCAGRAGRLGHSESGRSFVLVDEHGFADGIANHFLGGTPEAIESAIPRTRLIEHVLGAIASRIALTREDVHRLFEGSFAAATFYRLTGHEVLEQGIDDSLTRLGTSSLVETQQSGALRATALGGVVGRSGISVESASRIISVFNQSEYSFNDADLIFALCHCEEITGQRPFLRSEERLTNQWKNHIAGICEPGDTLHALIADRMLPGEDSNSALKRCCLALEWRSGTSERVLTTRYHTGLGSVHGLAENLAWLIGTASQISNAMSLPTSVVDRLHELGKEMHYGVPFSAVHFARLRVRGLGRAQLTRLVRNDTGRVFLSLEEVLDASPTEFSGIINPSIVPKLQEAILRSMNESLRRYEAGLLVRARRLSVPEALVKDLFSSQGVDFERAVENILNCDRISLGAVRLTRQRGGEVDLYISNPSGGCIVIGATSSNDNARPISWDKAREVLGAVGAPTPIMNFVVLGKPDFHETARRNADEIVQDPTRSILLLPVGAFGELCLEVFEQSRSPESLADILATRRGYYRSTEQT
jgi:helicase